MIFTARYLDRAEALQMLGDELRIEELESADSQPRYEMDQRHLACIGRAAEHALAEKCRAELDAVEAADQPVVRPAFDAMGGPAMEKRGIEADDLVVDPGLRPFARLFGAAAHDRLEFVVAAYGEAAAPHGAAQPTRPMEAIE